jgi:hypothetical protein
MPKGFQKGPLHPRWKGGQSTSSHGYAKIQVGKDHHLADPNGYAYVHQLEAEKTLGRALQKGEIVHHGENGKSDNSPDNLAVVTKAEHNRIHNAGRRDPRTGRYLPKAQVAVT